MLYAYRTARGAVIPQSIHSDPSLVVEWAHAAGLGITPREMQTGRRLVVVAIAVLGEAEVPPCYLMPMPKGGGSGG